MTALAAHKLHLAPEAVLVASTGKIGMAMPMDKVRRAWRSWWSCPTAATTSPRPS